MKTMKYLPLKALAVLAIAIGFALPGKAQTLGNYYANIDWPPGRLESMAGLKNAISSITPSIRASWIAWRTSICRTLSFLREKVTTVGSVHRNAILSGLKRSM